MTLCQLIEKFREKGIAAAYGYAFLMEISRFSALCRNQRNFRWQCYRLQVFIPDKYFCNFIFFCFFNIKRGAAGVGERNEINAVEFARLVI